MTIPEYKAAVLDMDGVITRTARVHARAWKQMFDEFLDGRGSREGKSNEPFDIKQDYRTYIDGKPRYDGVRSFLESRDIHLPDGEESDDPGDETVHGLGNRKNNLFLEMVNRDGVDVFEDTVEQINRWKKRGIKVAVFSSSRNCGVVLDSAGLGGVFDARVDGIDLERLGIRGKPEPDMLVEAARRLDAKPEHTVMAEDAIAGVEAGRKGGFGLVVGVDRDGGAEGLLKAGADIVVRDLRDIDAAAYCPPDTDCLSAPSSAVEYAEWIAGRLREKRLGLFLDYDGTLTPIVRRPEDAILSDEMRTLIERLAGACTVAVVSGRDRRDVEKIVGIDTLVYAGSHGYDIKGPGGLALEHDAARKVLPDIDDVERELIDAIGEISGARVERKRFAVAVHYREVEDEADVRKIEQMVDEAQERHPALRKMSGKRVFELQPDVEWDKGHAVEWLRESLGMDGDDTITIYIGDDTTDEDAFRMLRRHGTGIGIRVGSEFDRTDALYHLRDCDDVQRFLENLAAVLPKSDKRGDDK
ncbi:MAG: trehalose-phosphatase [bacterium]